MSKLIPAMMAILKVLINLRRVKENQMTLQATALMILVPQKSERSNKTYHITMTDSTISNNQARTMKETGLKQHFRNPIKTKTTQTKTKMMALTSSTTLRQPRVRAKETKKTGLRLNFKSQSHTKRLLRRQLLNLPSNLHSQI